jgi:FtsH-binding integral membrane protein
LHHYGPDDYIMAAIALYLDLINLFLYMLELLRMLQGGDN